MYVPFLQTLIKINYFIYIFLVKKLNTDSCSNGFKGVFLEAEKLVNVETIIPAGFWTGRNGQI